MTIDKAQLSPLRWFYPYALFAGHAVCVYKTGSAAEIFLWERDGRGKMEGKKNLSGRICGSEPSFKMLAPSTAFSRSSLLTTGAAGADHLNHDHRKMWEPRKETMVGREKMKQQTDDPVITDLQGKQTMTTACSHHLMRETSSISQHPLLRKLQPPEALTSPAKLGFALLICSATWWQCACALSPLQNSWSHHRACGVVVGNHKTLILHP